MTQKRLFWRNVVVMTACLAISCATSFAQSIYGNYTGTAEAKCALLGINETFSNVTVELTSSALEIAEMDLGGGVTMPSYSLGVTITPSGSDYLLSAAPVNIVIPEIIVPITSPILPGTTLINTPATITLKSGSKVTGDIMILKIEIVARLGGIFPVTLTVDFEGQLESPIYHPDDKEGLRAFLRQVSAVAGKINAEQVGLTLADTLSWQTSEDWVDKVYNLVWNSESPKRLTQIDAGSDGWQGLPIAGSLDASKWAALTHLQCQETEITALNVSGLTALQLLYCYYCKITTLNLNGATALTDLSCYVNEITSLNLSSNTLLKNLSCSTNPLSALDLSANTQLTYLECYQNTLSALDVSANTALTVLGCQSNQLTALDVRANTLLRILDCVDNQLSSLNVSDNTALQILYCNNNQLSTLDVSANTLLRILECAENKLSALDVSANTALQSIMCFDNELTTLDIGSGMKYVNCPNNRLMLSELYKIRQKLFANGVTLSEYNTGTRLGTQTRPEENVVIGEEVDFSPPQNYFGTTYTEFEVTQGGFPAATSDYTVTNGKITFNNQGVYTVKMTNAAIGGSSVYPANLTIEYNVTDGTGIKTITNGELRVYPNPTKGELRIENEELGMKNIEIFDMFGNLTPVPSPIWRGVSEGRGEVDISHLPAGIYFLKVAGKTVKVIKQ